MVQISTTFPLYFHESLSVRESLARRVPLFFSLLGSMLDGDVLRKSYHDGLFVMITVNVSGPVLPKPDYGSSMHNNIISPVDVRLFSVNYTLGVVQLFQENSIVVGTVRIHDDRLYRRQSLISTVLEC